MKASYVFDKKEKNDVTFKMNIPADKFEEAVKSAYQKNRGKYVVDGFRKGKAPRQIMEMKYGESLFYDDAINIIFPAEYKQAIEELNLDPVDRPTIDIEQIGKKTDLVIIVTVTVKPEVILGEYKGIEAKEIEYNVTDAEIDQEIFGMQERSARIIDVDRAIQIGDLVRIDYEGFVGDEQFEGGTAKDQSLTIGSGTYIPGFEEQLIGFKAGDEVDVKVTFPEDYHDNLASKEALFKAKINQVQEKQLAEPDDEFAKDVSEFDTMEELKKDIVERQQKRKKDKAETDQKAQIIEKVLENVQIEIPEIMVEDQLEDMVRDFDFQLQYQGLNLETYLKYISKTEDDLKKDMRTGALKKVKTTLTLEKIAEIEKVEISDEDVEEELVKISEEYNQSVEDFKKKLQPQNYERIKQDLKITRTIKLLVDNAKIA